MKPTRLRRHIGLMAAAVLCAFLAGGSTANAGVSFIIDRESLDDLLTALVTDRVEVPVGSETTITLFLEDLKITGFDPSAGDERQGYVLTSLKVRIPDLGVELAVEPRISLNVANKGGANLLELRFEELVLPLPLLGSINVGGLIRPIRYNADNIWLLDGAKGEVPVSSRLEEIVMGRDAIRFLFDIEVLAIAGGSQ